jgi:capsular exopolysaccharide synthesis family protein
MAAFTGHSVVGRIPPSRALARRPIEAFSDPGIGSAFRTMRANIEPYLREHGVRVLVITSPTKGDGKTRVAALASESLARAGQRVLLIDGDFHRPQLGHVANLDVRRGFSDLLEGNGSLSSALRPGWIENLSLLPTKPDSEAGDLLRRRFGSVLDGAASEFDLIVVDSPPLLGTNDARTLATLASGVIVVVQMGTSVSTLNEAILALESLNAPIVGLVANKLKEARSYYQYE